MEEKETKKCAKCKLEFPKTSEYFLKHKTSGFQGYCKECRSNYHKSWYRENAQHCKEYSKNYDYLNPDVKKRKDEKYFSKAPDRRIRADKKVCNFCETEQPTTNFSKNYGKDGYNNKCKSCIRIRVMNKKYIEHKFELTPEVWGSILEVFNKKCAYCFSDQYSLTIDHFIPIFRGGKHEIYNLVPACVNCNAKKHKNEPYEWIFSTFGSPHIMLTYGVQ